MLIAYIVSQVLVQEMHKESESQLIEPQIDVKMIVLQNDTCQPISHLSNIEKKHIYIYILPMYICRDGDP